MKKYLKTPEEVISALKEGKTVYSACGKYKMIDNILVFKCGNLHTINASISLDEKPYIEGPEPFKIEVGKFYKSREGHKVYCYCANSENAFFVRDGEVEGYMTDLKGNFWANENPYSKYDIIGPWEE